jgi:hypothetical protein
MRHRGMLISAVAAACAATVLAAAPALAAAGGGAGAKPASVGPGVISTIAGGAGGPGQARKINLGTAGVGVAFSSGSLYIGLGLSVRKVSPATGLLTMVAGTGEPGPLGDGGRALTASIDGGTAVTIDHAGNVLIAETGDNRIRAIAASTGTFYGQAMKAGHIYPIVGTGHRGFSGDGGPATAAKLKDPADLGTDSAGNVVFADRGNNRIRVVAVKTGTYYGQAMTAGDIYTIAGDGTAGFAGNGGPATSAELNGPGGVAVDGAGNVVIADTNNQRIRVVAVKTGTFYGRAMTAGDIYTIAGDGTAGFAGDGGPATSAQINGPEGVRVDGAGNVIIPDTNNQRIRVVAAGTGTFYGQAMTAGDIYTIAGDGGQGTAGAGGPATAAELDSPGVTAVDTAGNLLIAENHEKVGQNHSVEVQALAAHTGTFYGLAMTAGHLYTIAGDNNHNFPANGHRATWAQLNPAGVAFDAAGNLLIADSRGNYVMVVAGRTGTFYGRAMTAGHIYTVAGDGREGSSGDGGLATSAEMHAPSGVAADAAGNLVIADKYNNQIRVVAGGTGTFYGQPMTAGHIYTVAGTGRSGFSGDGGPATSAQLSVPTAVMVDSAGNLVISDQFNNRIRVVAGSTGTFYGQAMTAGDIYTIAGGGNDGLGDGGPATSAQLNFPTGTALDAAGNLVIADLFSNRIRVVAESTGTFYGQAMTAGDIYTVAGTGQDGFSGDGGPATSAELNRPAGVVADSAGNLVIADQSNNRIRVVAEHTGTFYGQPMTAGDIYTIAGNGRAAFSGNGGPGERAELNTPTDVALTPAGNIAIADWENGRVRMVTS